MSQANDAYKNDKTDDEKNKYEPLEIGDVDELIFPDNDSYYISER